MMQPFLSSSTNNIPSTHNRHENEPRDAYSSILEEKRVVVVEDEGITQMQLRRILKNAGLMVVASAISGEQGVEAVLHHRPDLVLMDIRMPGPVDGLDAARQILAVYSVCIVMLTAFSDEEYRQRAGEIPVCGYVLKPVMSESLIPRLETLFQQFKS